MPNPTARTIANKCLLACGLTPIPSDSVYATVTDKYQVQMTVLLDLIQGKFGITMNKRFNIRKFTFNTVGPTLGVPVTQYTIPNASVEGFKANSFNNISSTSGVYNGRIDVMTYEQWRRAFPDPSVQQAGPPRWLIPLPDDGSGDCNVTIYPYADQAYTIEGLARIVYVPIETGASETMFPVMYQHALIFSGIALLETRMNEGRQADFSNLADKCIEEVMRDASGAYEEEDPMDTGISLFGGGSRTGTVRDYNPETDIVPPYNG